MKVIRILIGLLISIVLLGLIFHNIDWAELREVLAGIQYLWLPVSILVYLTGIWIRTTRWAILMNPVKRCSTHRLFPVYVISYMANNILPLRMGDFYRAYFTGKREGVSKGATLVTVGVERIFDGLTMLILLASSFMFYPVSDATVKLAIQWGTLLFLSALVACYLVVLNRNVANWILERILILMPERFHEKLRTVFGHFFQGLDSLKGIREIMFVIGLSLVTWILEALSYWIVLWAFGFYGGFYVAVSTMALVNLMIIVPAGPGYFGPFEWACIIMLGKSGYGSLTHFTKEIATAYALVVHVAGQWIPSTVLGMIYMWKEHIGFKEIREDLESDGRAKSRPDLLKGEV